MKIQKLFSQILVRLLFLIIFYIPNSAMSQSVTYSSIDLSAFDGRYQKKGNFIGSWIFLNNVKIDGRKAQKFKVGFGIAGHFNGSLETIEFSSFQTFSNMPRSIAQQYDNDWSGNRFFLNNTSFRKAAEASKALNGDDKIIFKAICGLMSDGEFVKSITERLANFSAKEMGRKYVDSKFNEYWSSDQRAWTLVKSANICNVKAKNAGSKKITFTKSGSASVTDTKSACGYTFDKPKSSLQLVAIQKALMKRKLYTGRLDGIFGSGTCAALSKWAYCAKVGENLSEGMLNILLRSTPRNRDMACYGQSKVAEVPKQSVTPEDNTAILPKKPDSKVSTLRSQVDIMKLKKQQVDIMRLEKQKELLLQRQKEKSGQILLLKKQVSIAQSNSDNDEVTVLENKIKSLTGNLNKLLNKYDAQTLDVNDAKADLLMANKQAVAYRAEKTKLELALKEKTSEISALILKLKVAKNLDSKLQSTLLRAEAKLKNDAEAFQIRIADLEVQVASLTTELKERISVSVQPPQGFTLSEDWSQYKQWITPSQMRFCSILHEYEVAKQEAASSGNQLLQNIAIRERDSDIAALLNVSRSGQDGFRSWVSVVESVFAMDAMNPSSGKVELAAGVILKTPCNVTLGTGRVIDQIGNAASEFKYLAFDGDLIFSQLTSVRRGDPVLFDGIFERSKTGASEMFVTNKLGKEEKLEAYDRPADAPDMFVNITYLAKL